MKLYYSPGACSLSPHIVLREAKLPFELVRVDFMRGKKLPDGRCLRDVNPKGYIPVLELDDGEVLTEGVAIVQYVADLVPDLQLAPLHGTFDRVRLQESLNFVATELHKAMLPLFSASTPREYKETIRANVAERMGLLSAQLGAKPYLMGGHFTVVDAYVFYVLRSWHRITGAEPPANLGVYHSRVATRPAVVAAMEAEGITRWAASRASKAHG